MEGAVADLVGTPGEVLVHPTGQVEGIEEAAPHGTLSHSGSCVGRFCYAGNQCSPHLYYVSVLQNLIKFEMQGGLM